MLRQSRSWGRTLLAILGGVMTAGSAWGQPLQAWHHPTPTRSLISSNQSHSLMVRADGSVWAWGNNNKPGQVPGLSNVEEVATSLDHTYALREDGTVWTWGANVSGQLGDGTTVDRAEPHQVPGLTGVAALAAGHQSSLALRADGTLRAWGTNIYCEVGDGVSIIRTTPARERLPSLVAH